MHDDQHGTAVVLLAALTNALKVVGKRMEDIRIVVNGLGAAGTACCRILLAAGACHLVGCDKEGIVLMGEAEELRACRSDLQACIRRDQPRGTLHGALRGADVFIGLSVGGTLSVGGIGGQAFRHGLQVDNVIELEVVTGKGQLVTCSAHHNRDLFDAARAGLGQFGIIVRARLRLVDVPSHARTYTAVYDELALMADDQRAAVASGDFDYVEGSAFFGATGWQYQIELVRYFDPAAPPDDAALLADLHALPGTTVINDSSYFDFTNRLAPTLAFLESVGALALPHPWMDLFVPGSAVVPYVESVLAQLTPADTGNGPVLIYPFRRAALTTPFLRVPAEEEIFLFAVLRFTVPPIPPVIDAQNAQNRAFCEANMALGGKLYPIDSFPFSHADWEAHFGARWSDFEDAKEAFDPDHVLTPGQGIF